MSLQAAVLPALTGERKDLSARLLVAALVPLSLTYTVGLKAYLALYNLGLRKRRRLPCCVVSVGNLASGGTGKTGLTISLARALHGEGRRVCVLSRGYGGARERGVGIVSDGREVLMTAAEAGDEPYLIASSVPDVPVLVGRDRRRSGDLAVSRFRPELILLDDGMQYYQLHRDVEIVLLSGERSFGNGWALPAGVLREPVSHLRRASCIVVSGHWTSPDRPWLTALAERSGIPVFEAAYHPVSLSLVGASERAPVGALAGHQVATLCALGNPSAFEATVENAGCLLVRRFRLPDHGAPSSELLSEMGAEAVRHGAATLVISAKDAVKMPSASMPLPVWVLEAEYRVAEMDPLLEMVRSAMTRGESRGACG